MSANANFIATPKTGSINIATANLLRDGTGTMGTVLTAPTTGSRIDTVCITAQGSTTAGAVRLFIHDGTTTRFLTEVLVPAVTASTTVSPFSVTLSPLQGNFWLPLVLQSAYSLRASTNNAEAFNVHAVLAGDF